MVPTEQRRTGFTHTTNPVRFDWVCKYECCKPNQSVTWIPCELRFRASFDGRWAADRRAGSMEKTVVAAGKHAHNLLHPSPHYFNSNFHQLGLYAFGCCAWMTKRPKAWSPFLRRSSAPCAKFEVSVLRNHDMRVTAYVDRLQAAADDLYRRQNELVLGKQIGRASCRERVS